jgi:hypothetical protein
MERREIDHVTEQCGTGLLIPGIRVPVSIVPEQKLAHSPFLFFECLNKFLFVGGSAKTNLYLTHFIPSGKMNLLTWSKISLGQMACVVVLINSKYLAAGTRSTTTTFKGNTIS